MPCSSTAIILSSQQQVQTVSRKLPAPCADVWADAEGGLGGFHHMFPMSGVTSVERGGSRLDNKLQLDTGLADAPQTQCQLALPFLHSFNSLWRHAAQHMLDSARMARCTAQPISPGSTAPAHDA